MIRQYKKQQMREFKPINPRAYPVPSGNFKKTHVSHYPMRLASKYQEAIMRLARPMIKEAEAYAKKLFEYMTLRDINFFEDAKEEKGKKEKPEKKQEEKKAKPAKKQEGKKAKPAKKQEGKKEKPAKKRQKKKEAKKEEKKEKKERKPRMSKEERKADNERIKKEKLEAMRKLVEETNQKFAQASAFPTQFGFDALQKKYDAIFDKSAPSFAETFVKNIDEASKKDEMKRTPAAFHEIKIENIIKSEGLSKDIEQMVQNNVGLIKSIPKEYLGKIEKATNEALFTNKGGGAYDIQQSLLKFSDQIAPMSGSVEKRILTIARTQTIRNYSDLGTLRQKKLGFRFFQWLHTGASHTPRKDHVARSGKTYSYDDDRLRDPKTGEVVYPGQLINCHCIKIPILETDSL